MNARIVDFDDYLGASERTHRRTDDEHARCVTCRTPWPCRHARWQEQWLATLNQPGDADGAADVGTGDAEYLAVWAR